MEAIHIHPRGAHEPSGKPQASSYCRLHEIGQDQSSLNYFIMTVKQLLLLQIAGSIEVSESIITLKAN